MSDAAFCANVVGKSVAWLLVLPLAGCLSSPAPPPDAGPGHAPVSGSFVAGFDLVDCTHSTISVFPPLSDLQASLPEGFEAMPAEAVLDFLLLPSVDLDTGETSLTGKGLLLFLLHPCAQALGLDGRADQLFVWIPVLRPEPDMSLTGEAFHFYMLHHSSTGPGADQWDATRLPNPGYLTAIGALTGDDMTGRGHEATVSQGDEEVARLQFASARSASNVQGTFRIWSKTETGLILAESAYMPGGSPVFSGRNPQCTFAEGSELAEIMGFTSCADVPALLPTGGYTGFHAHTDLTLSFHEGWTDGGFVRPR